MTTERIRVVVAGDVYANRALVRPFLEDDGYEVVGEAFDRADLLPQVIREQPDAVVIDEGILSARRNGRALDRIRRAAPDAKLVVVAADPAAARFAKADATLEAGLSLAALSALLGRLFAQERPRLPPPPVPTGTLIGAGALANASARAGASTRTESNGAVARFVATVGLPLVVVWVVIAVLTTGGRGILQRADATDLAAGGVAVIPMPGGPLEGARESLDRLIHAIVAGNQVLATAHARALMDARTTAVSLGYVTNGLDAQVRSRLAGVAGLLSAGISGSLAAVLDGLFPELGGATDPGGGSGIILTPSVGTGGTGAVLTAGLRGQGNGGARNRGGSGGQGDGGTVVAPAPGDGRAWGQSHNPSRPSGGPPAWANGNGPPPWANGNQGSDQGTSDVPSEHLGAHAHGHAYGHDKDHGHHNGHGR